MSAHTELNLDRDETEKFEALASTWWDPEGPMRPLHDLNPSRVRYVSERCELHGKDVLDVGCGGGILSESLAMQGANVMGIDAAKRVVRVAELHRQESGLGMQYEAVTIEEMAAKSEKVFDVITCMEMLEHVPDPVSVVRSIANLIKPGGNAFFSTLNRTPIGYLLGIVAAEYVAGVCPRGTHRYDRFIRPSELGAWLRIAGMRVMDISGIHYNPVSRSVMVGGHVQMNYLIHACKAEAGDPGLGVSSTNHAGQGE